MICLGVLADTHIPDRRRSLHPAILPLFEQAGVNAILHAGDVSIPSVLAQLGELAPVHAVRGNRDWVSLRSLPPFLELELEGVKVSLAHGHGRLGQYMQDKLHYAAFGLHASRYVQRLLQTFPGAGVIVFGHLHLPLNEWIRGQLVFNPGSACCPEKRSPAGEQKEHPASVGLLRLHAGEVMSSELIPLN